MLRNIGGINNTPAFKALVIPKKDLAHLSLQPAFPIIDLQLGEFKVEDGGWKKYADEVDLTTDDGKPSKFEPLSNQFVITSVKPKNPSIKQMLQNISSKRLTKDEAENELAKKYTYRSTVSCMQIDNDLILDRFKNS